MPAEFSSPVIGAERGGLVGDRLAFGGFGQVRDDRMDAVGGDRSKPGLVDVDGDNGRSAIGEMHRRFPAEPRRSAGDDHDPR